MKVKFTLIPFIPAALAMIIFRVMSIFGADDSGHFLGMDKMAVSYTAIGIAAVLFVACIIINIFDRKTSPVYPVKKNIAAAILSALSGAMVIASSVATFMNSTTDSEYYVMSLISAIASIPAGIAFFLMTRIHLQGKTVVSGLSTLFVFPAIWGCTEIVYEFLEATKVSISATDMTPLFCFIFLSLYYFSHAMVLSRVKGRSLRLRFHTAFTVSLPVFRKAADTLPYSMRECSLCLVRMRFRSSQRWRSIRSLRMSSR